MISYGASHFALTMSTDQKTKAILRDLLIFIANLLLLNIEYKKIIVILLGHSRPLWVSAAKAFIIISI
jgi:hypothetical protein